MAEFCIVHTTTDSENEAQRMARTLIENRLAACVQIEGPIKSIYHWNGQVESSDEFRLAIKTTTKKSSDVFRLIQEKHHYDVPEIIQVAVNSIDPAYANWMRNELESSDSGDSGGQPV